MISAGWLAARRGTLDEYTNAHVSKLILDIFNPLLIISSAAGAAGNISPGTVGTVIIIALGMFAVFIVVGMLLTPLFDKDAMQRKMFQMMFVFSNLGFIGIPVVSSILGEEYVVYITIFLLVYTVVLYTYGVSWMEGRFSLTSLRAMVNPGNICSVLALLMVLFGIQLPGFILTAVSYLGNVTSPLALMAVGYTLAHTGAREIFGQPRLYVFTVVKMVILPLLMLPLLRLVTSEPSLLSVCAVMFGMPVGNMPMLLATEKGIDTQTCTAAILLTTIASVVTIPILLMVVQRM